MLEKRLQERDLLPILPTEDGAQTAASWPRRRQEMLEALMQYSYGRTPRAPHRVWAEALSVPHDFACAYGGKVRQEKWMLHMQTEHGVFAFPIALAIPVRTKKPPVILHIAFRPNMPDEYMPVEEITDAGFALAVVCYTDMVNDNHFGDFSDGLSAHFSTSCPRQPDEWGKIGMWAYGASRVLDYLLTREDLDSAHTAVLGHSRLGKTALWAAAQDERFWAAISNDSGYGGAATSKHGQGERVRDFLNAGSWDWFCENFKQFTDEKENEKPYDQSWLLALIAPRLLCVGSAQNDAGADPESEFLTSLFASQAWTLLGEEGLITPDRLPQAGDSLHAGAVGYHLRAGGHFLSREDWQQYIHFLNLHLDRSSAK